ncbi:hypothetical protein MUB42_00825 [Apilactobacillus kunkeei]|nr:hypothetical protein MUB42_00825 [Apilactobacillus kunkeei]
MNPVLKLLMMLVIALEISFTTSVRLNIVIFVVSLIYLIFFLQLSEFYTYYSLP